MKVNTAALVAGAITLSVSTTALAQNQQQTPPPRVVGGVQVDQVTPAPLRIVRGIYLNATPAEAFGVVSSADRFVEFIDMVDSVRVSGSGDRGTTRTFQLANGAQVSERVVAYNEPGSGTGGSFAFSLAPDNPFGMSDHLAVLDVQPAEGGGAYLQIHHFFNHPDASAVTPAITGGLEQITDGLLAEFGGAHRIAVDTSSGVQIRTSRIVDVSAERAWEVLGEQWGQVDEWSSLVMHSEMSGGSSGSPDGATRACDIPGFPPLKERMLRFDESDLRLSYQVVQGAPPFAPRVTNSWDIRPIGPERVVVSSVIDMSIAPQTPPPAIGMVAGQFAQVMDLTFDEYVHFAETGEPHPREAMMRPRQP